METNFFKSLATIKVKEDWKITVKRVDDDQLAVSVLLSGDKIGDKAANLVQPMVLVGTAAELDQGFFDSISTPAQKTAALFANMEAHMKSLEEAAKKSKMEQDRKRDTQPAPDAEKEAAMTAAYEECMKTVNELEKDMKYSAALEALPNVTDYPKKEQELSKKRKDLAIKVKLGATLF